MPLSRSPHLDNVMSLTGFELSPRFHHAFMTGPEDVRGQGVLSNDLLGPVRHSSPDRCIEHLKGCVPVVLGDVLHHLLKLWHKSSQLAFPVCSVLGLNSYFGNGNFRASPDAALNGYAKFNVTQLKHTPGTRIICVLTRTLTFSRQYGFSLMGRAPC